MDEQELARYKKLSPREIEERLQGLDGWSLNGDRIEKEYEFANFARAMVFLNQAVNPIEENQNYPFITIKFNRVLMSLKHPEVGAITVMDIEMAQAFDELKK